MTTERWPGYTPEAQAYEIATRPAPDYDDLDDPIDLPWPHAYQSDSMGCCVCCDVDEADHPTAAALAEAADYAQARATTLSVCGREGLGRVRVFGHRS